METKANTQKKVKRDTTPAPEVKQKGVRACDKTGDPLWSRMKITLRTGEQIFTEWEKIPIEQISIGQWCRATLMDALQKHSIDKEDVFVASKETLAERFIFERYEDVKVSDHAYQRLKERMGLGKKSAVRIAQKAYDEGDTPQNTSQYVGDWAKGSGNVYKIWKNNVFVFGTNRLLVTVFPCNSRLKQHDLMEKSFYAHRDEYKRLQKKAHIQQRIKEWNDPIC